MEIPSIKVSKMRKKVVIKIDEENNYEYASPKFKNHIQSEFKKLIDGRPREDENLGNLKRDIEGFITKYIKNKMIIKSSKMDRLYGNRMIGPALNSSSVVKTVP